MRPALDAFTPAEIAAAAGVTRTRVTQARVGGQHTRSQQFQRGGIRDDLPAIGVKRADRFIASAGDVQPLTGPAPKPAVAKLIEASFALEPGQTMVSVDYPDWHFNVRASNTEPLIRLNLEAATPEQMRQKRDEVLGVIRG